MDADWDEMSIVTVPPPGPHLIPTIATTVVFDDFQELIWAGNEFGRVTSFYGPEMQRYTSVQAHPTQEGPVHQILSHDNGLISVSSKSIHMVSRRGLTQWHLSHPGMEDLRCMSFTAASSNRLLVAGCQPKMFIIDVDKGCIVEELDTEYKYTILRRSSRCMCAATDAGYVNVLQLTNYSLIKTFRAHGFKINDMDARNDILVTCGFSIRHMGNQIAEPLASVFDLKNLVPLNPIPFHAGAAFVRMHPRLQTTSYIASQTGQIQVVDLMNPSAFQLRQANVRMVLGLEVSSSAEALLINDAECLIHLWGSPSKIYFNEMPRETKLADIPSRPPIPIDLNDTSVPLSSVGIPYYKDKLLSAWPSHLVFDVGKPNRPIDSAIIQNLRPAGVGQYAANPQKTRRYQVKTHRAQVGSESSLIAPQFLSEKAKIKSQATSPDKAVAVATEAMDDMDLGLNTEEDPLLKYSNVEIKYSKFGVDDFDFRFYNKTEYSGLETHIANSFINPLLQVFKFTPLLRNIALHHVAARCLNASCLLCETGFFFDMLDKANGQNCQATNLLRTFSSFREATNLGLLEGDLASKSFCTTIQGVHRLFLNQLMRDFRAHSPMYSRLDDIMLRTASQYIRCIYCGNEMARPGQVSVHDFIYPAPSSSTTTPYKNIPHHGFSDALRQSLEHEQLSRGFCDNCRRYQQLSLHRTAVHNMPSVLTFNTIVTKATESQHFWSEIGLLPSEIGILVLDDGRLHCFDGQELDVVKRRKPPGLLEYELVGSVVEIDIPEYDKPHLVSFINVSISSREPSEQNRWYLFNDFLVTEVSKEEALSFSQRWKTPCTLTYQIKTARNAIDDSWKDHLDTSLLFQEWSLNDRASTQICKTLEATEMPGPKTPVALDTEFVDLQKAETEVKADGSEEMIRPSRSGLARVSVIRGQGPREGLPFIDDYITINDRIVDYVTQYSGIRPGDLDLQSSSRNLVPLKVAYKKLWLLLNLGCIFVGHGLASDFRKINIQVPKTQTVDTQFLYFNPSKNRRLSLRYLAWAVFREYIQEDPAPMTADDGGPPTVNSSAAIEGHDSIEDARMALRLWKKFIEFKDAGVITQILEDIFRDGVRLGYRPPPRVALGSNDNGNSNDNNKITPQISAISLASSGGSASAAPSGAPTRRNTPEPGASNGNVSLLTPSTSSNGVINPSNTNVWASSHKPLQPSTGLMPDSASYTGVNSLPSDVFR